MQFSITLDCPPDDNLKRLLSSRRDHISHIYLVNRFRLSTESPEEHSRALAGLCRFNLELVFALDDSCMGGWQLVGAFQERLIITLSELAQLGIKAVSLADPFLAQFFRSPFPPHDDLHSFRLYLGVNAKLTEGCKLRYLDLSQLNLLTLHPRLNDETRGMIGAEQIALLPEGAILVNCARPPILDYDALCDALDSGHLYAAAADVLPAEPLPPEHRLLHTDRLIVTPHLAGASRQSAQLAAEKGAADIARFLRGEPLQYALN